jgi:tetratricopeptide (TPR) repeat protein
MKINQEGNNKVNVLICQYEALSQNESVPFFEKTAFWQIALHYQMQLKLDKAATALEHALTFYTHNPEFHIFSAEVSLQRGKYKLAVTSIRKAQTLISEEAHQTIYRIEAYLELGHINSAIDALCKFKSICGDLCVVEQVIAFPEYMRNIRKTEVMLDYLIELMRANPANDHTLQQLYFCMEATGQYETVIPVLHEVLEHDPMNAAAWFNLGMAWQQTGQPHDALDAFEYAMISDQNHMGAYIEFANTAFDLERYRTALQTWQEITNRFEIIPENLVRTGECYEILGEPEIAFDLYQRAVEMNRECTQGLYKLGHAFLRDKKFAEARAHFRAGQKVDPFDETFDLSLAATHIEMGNQIAALKALRKAFQNNPENPNCAIALIMLLLDCDKDKQAYQKCREAMLYHNNVPVLTALRGVAVLRLGKKREGYTWIRTAMDEGLKNTDLVYRFLKDADQILEG